MLTEITDVNLYLQHVQYLFKVQLAGTILNLSQEDKNKFFDFVDKNAQLIETLIKPMKSYIIDNALGTMAPDSTPTAAEQEIINQFNTWKQS